MEVCAGCHAPFGVEVVYREMIEALGTRLPEDIARTIANMAYHGRHRLVFTDTVFTAWGERYCDTHSVEICGACLHCGIDRVIQVTGRLPHLRWHTAFFLFPSTYYSRQHYSPVNTDFYALVLPHTYELRYDHVALPVRRHGRAWVTSE